MSSFLDINKSAQPYAYYKKYIKENYRPDNRKLNEFREIKIDIDCINTANGSALCKLGSTMVICGVKAHMCKPRDNTKGYIIPNVDLTPLSSSSFKSGAPSEHAQMLTQLMFDIICESKCIKEEDLCIKSGLLAWTLYIDLICLNYDGNLQDACCLAMISALKCTKLYDICYDDELNKPIFKQPIGYVNLPVYCEPICTTLFLLDNSILICDPNKEEEDYLKSSVILCTLDKTRVCLIRKLGAYQIFDEQIDLCIDKAFKNGDYIRMNIINNKLFEIKLKI